MKSTSFYDNKKNNNNINNDDGGGSGDVPKSSSPPSVIDITEIPLFASDAMFTVLCDRKGDIQIHSNEMMLFDDYPSVFKKPKDRCGKLSEATKITKLSNDHSLVSVHSLPFGEIPQKIQIEGGPVFVLTQLGSMYIITRPCVVYENKESKLFYMDLPFQVKEFSCNDRTLVLLSEDESYQWEAQTLWQINDVHHHSIIGAEAFNVKHDESSVEDEGSTPVSFLSEHNRRFIQCRLKLMKKLSLLSDKQNQNEDEESSQGGYRRRLNSSPQRKTSAPPILSKLLGVPLGIAAICVGRRHATLLDVGGRVYLWSCTAVVTHDSRRNHNTEERLFEQWSSSSSSSSSKTNNRSIFVEIFKPEDESQKCVQLVVYGDGFLMRTLCGEVFEISIKNRDRRHPLREWRILSSSCHFVGVSSFKSKKKKKKKKSTIHLKSSVMTTKKNQQQSIKIKRFIDKKLYPNIKYIKVCDSFILFWNDGEDKPPNDVNTDDNEKQDGDSSSFRQDDSAPPKGWYISSESIREHKYNCTHCNANDVHDDDQPYCCLDGDRRCNHHPDNEQRSSPMITATTTTFQQRLFKRKTKTLLRDHHRRRFVHVPELMLLIHPSDINGCSSGSLSYYCLFSNDRNQMISIGDHKPIVVREMARDFHSLEGSLCSPSPTTEDDHPYPISLFPSQCDYDLRVDQEKRKRKLFKLRQKISFLKDSSVNSSDF